MSEREFQRHAESAVFAEWEDVQSTLVVMPTGTGKTVLASNIIKHFPPKRTLFLAHREELIFQAAKTIRNHAYLGVDIEMADLWAGDTLWDADVIVSTIQTQIAGKKNHERMTRFDPSHFGLVVVDEAHRVTASSYRRVLSHYKQNPDLKILCLTATPDRADEEALGQMIDSVAFDYEIVDAINDGWLVPIEQQMVFVEGLDFSKVKTQGNDLSASDLAAVMEAEKNLQGVAASSIEIIGDRRTLVFTAGVKQAEMLCEIFNRHREDMAGWVCGTTPKDQRRDLLNRFADGRTQVVVNCNCLSEGFDNPGVEVVIQARPTKSRSLYAQQAGRSTRPLAGCVDDLGSAEERRAAIAASAKPSCLIVDFVGNAGRHKLMTTADILGGKVSPEAMERAVAKAKAEGKPMRMADALEASENAIRAEAEERRKREAARKAHLIAQAEFKTKSVDPFDILDIRPKQSRGWDEGKSLTPNQRAVLLRQGVNITGMPYGQQKQLLTAIFKRMENKMASINQCKALRKRDINTDGLTFAQASERLNEIAQKEGWKPKTKQATQSGPAPARQSQHFPSAAMVLEEPDWMEERFR